VETCLAAAIELLQKKNEAFSHGRLLTFWVTLSRANGFFVVHFLHNPALARLT